MKTRPESRIETLLERGLRGRLSPGLEDQLGCKDSPNTHGVGVEDIGATVVIDSSGEA